MSGVFLFNFKCFAEFNGIGNTINFKPDFFSGRIINSVAVSAENKGKIGFYIFVNFYVCGVSSIFFSKPFIFL